MSSTTARAAGMEPLRGPMPTREIVRKALLACGALSVLVYVGWHEVAALQWDGYSRISNAISELHLTGAPSKWLLDPWEGIVYNALLIAFGIGVWQSAHGRRSLHVVGGLLVLAGATWPLWMLFSEASLAAHLVLSMLGIATWLGGMAFAAIAFPGRFRYYSLASLAVVVLFFVPAFLYAPAVAAGDPTPYIGLSERLAFSTYFLWTSVLVVTLWRRKPDEEGEAVIEAPRAAQPVR